LPAGFVSRHDKLCAIAGNQLGEQSSDVGLDSGDADRQYIGDLGVRPSGRDLFEDLILAGCQVIEFGAADGEPAGLPGELCDESMGDAGGEQGIAGGDDSDSRSVLSATSTDPRPR
jgi:hypothetical protein